jgi:hypothetical protein
MIVLHTAYCPHIVQVEPVVMQHVLSYYSVYIEVRRLRICSRKDLTKPTRSIKVLKVFELGIKLAVVN